MSWQSLWCWLLGHEYVVLRRMNPGARKVGCERCGGQWGMHDETRAFIPWNSELEAFYDRNNPWWRKP